VKIIAIKDNKISLSMKALIEAEEEKLNQEVKDYHEGGKASTSLGSLLAGLKLEK